MLHAVAEEWPPAATSDPQNSPGKRTSRMGSSVPIVGRNPFAGRDRGGMADQDDQLAAATGLDPQDTKAVLGVLVSDALD